ncbi:MAG TPA: hypothetical protein VGJ84_13520 [Polyangiaceae bacterium]|jgi:hypothetical protein
MILNSKRYELGIAKALLFVGALSACSTTPLRFQSSNDTDEQPRRPPGVAVDPVSELPDPAPRASSQERLAVLRAPFDMRAARAVVRAFFQAVAAESPERLDQVVSGAAWVYRSQRSERQLARAFWRLRFGTLDYESLRGHLPYRESEVQTYRADDVERLGAARQSIVTPTGEDVMVRVPVAGPSPGQPRLFGDEIVFLLESTASGYVISAMAEDFRLP